MPYLVDINGNILKPCEKIISLISEDCKIQKIVNDTEFTTTEKLTVDSIQLYFPTLNPNYSLVYPYEELDDDFNPFLDPLEIYGNNIEYLDEDVFGEIYECIEDKFLELTEDEISGRKIRKIFEDKLKEGYFDEELKAVDFKRENISIKRLRDKSYELVFNFNPLLIQYESFFADVDIFKTIGKNLQFLFLEAELESRRVITTYFSKAIVIPNPIKINGIYYEVSIRLRDAMNRFPVLSGRGLDNQCKVYKTIFQKKDVESDELAGKLGLTSKDDIKKNMSLFKSLEPTLFYLYGANDVFATHSLSDKQQELLDGIRKDFKLKTTEVKDTTGSNVSTFILDLQHKHFNPSEDKDINKLIKSKRRQAHADVIQSQDYNDFGIQPLRTVGGLLYSRMQRYPYLKGLFGDLDMSSCYATRLSELTIYLGQPIISSFKGKKYKPRLKDVLDFVEKNCPRDGWVIRVSGVFEKAINTILLSDLDFTPKKVTFKTIFDVDPGRKSIGQFNAYKTSNPEAKSTILTKECKFALLNADLIDCIRLLPDSWIVEYYNLAVDCIVFIPNELVCNSVDELNQKMQEYPEDENIEKFDKKTGLKNIDSQYSQKNLCLAFPIGDYYKQLKEKRTIYKKAKNPIQEVYKLFLNSGYGALACEHLPVNNLLAANQITASPRATAWLMINALNGFQVITDGCTFSWENIPLGRKFKHIIRENPNYLIDFDPTIKCELSEKLLNQKWIDENFTSHLLSFYEVDNNHIPANRYSYELKDETFTTQDGVNINTVVYTEFFNTGSGNYSKGLDDCVLYIEGQEYKFDEQFKKVKARSFKGKDKNLLNWYIESLQYEFKEPVIYSETQIIKFGEGNKLAIQFLQSGLEEIAHPVGMAKEVYKIMKLITRSQFLFQTENQLVNFEKRNQLAKLDNLSKFILTKSFWHQLKLENVAKYGVTEILENVDYYEFAKTHPVGLGFELLTLNNTHKGSIKSVRELIADKIKEGKSNFNATLHIDRNLNLVRAFKYLFASVIILKANAEEQLKNILLESVNEPTVLTVTSENIFKLADLLESPDL